MPLETKLPAPFRPFKHHATGSGWGGVSVRASFNQLVAVLGQPQFTDIDYKAPVEWVFTDDATSTLTTVYTYKDGDPRQHPDAMYDWHIGREQTGVDWRCGEWLRSLLHGDVDAR